jgi:hypothetical protein
MSHNSIILLVFVVGSSGRQEINSSLFLNFYYNQLKSRRTRWAVHVTRMEEGSGVYRVLVGKPEGKRPPGRPRRRWEDDIKADLQEMGCVSK